MALFLLILFYLFKVIFEGFIPRVGFPQIESTSFRTFAPHTRNIFTVSFKSNLLALSTLLLTQNSQPKHSKLNYTIAPPRITINGFQYTGVSQ